MEASALARASGRGLLARRSPLLRFEPDDRLVALIRAGHDGAFEALFNRYNTRLLGFCQSMLKSRQDAEDVLQEVFANAHSAMLKDERAIYVRPWLYRIARNRCLNHLRRPVPEGQDSMDVHPHQNGTTTAEQVQSREELRQVLDDVRTLPETQRTALLLREIDQLSYAEMAVAMDTTVPAIKSLLVRARIALAESSQARALTCDEVRVELAEAAEGIGKASGPVRKHVRSCEGCKDFRGQLRSDRKALAALFPIGPLAMLKGGLLGKLFGGGAAGGSAGAAGGSGGVSGVSGASAASGFSGGIGALGGAIGIKAAAGVATAALITAGAVEVRNITAQESATDPAPALAAEPPAPPPPDPEPPQYVAVAQPAADEPREEPRADAPPAGEPTDPVPPSEDVPAEEPAEEEPDPQAATEETEPEVETGEEDGTVTIDEGGEEPDPGSEPADPGTDPPDEGPTGGTIPPTDPSDVDDAPVGTEPEYEAEPEGGP